VLLALLLALAACFPATAPAPAAGRLSPAPALSAADTGPQTGLLVTAAATAEDVDPAVEPHGGIVIQASLANRTGQDVSGLTLRLPMPPRTRLADSGQGRLGQNPGAAQGGAIAWSGLALRNGADAGPFLYRVVPEPGADGAVVFRPASVQPEVTWTAPAAGRADPSTAPPLRLNGLWGEVGLRRTVLPSGFTIFTRERPDTATVALEVGVRAGSRDEDDTTWGGSHWLEHAHFLGTVKRPNNQAIFGAIEEVGGDINAATSHEYTTFYNVVPAENFDLGLDVLADQLLNSTFPLDAFEREKRVVFEELKRNFDDPSRRATDEFFRSVFQVSPLRRDAAGYVETVATIPIQTILAHRARLYVSGNMAIAAIGNLRHDEAVAKIAKAFEALPRAPRTPRPRVPEPVEMQPRRQEFGSGTRVAEIRMGWPVPGDDDEDSVALEILQDVLGTTGRRLTEEIRDRRALATSVGVSNATFSDAGAFLITATTQPANVDQVIDLVLAEIRRVRDSGVAPEDVAISRRARAGQRALSQELNAAQSGIADLEVFGTLDSYSEYLARLAPVTPADIQRVARTYLDPANFTLVIVRS